MLLPVDPVLLTLIPLADLDDARRALREQLRSLERKRTRANTAVTQAETELAALKTRDDAVRQDVARLEAEMSRFESQRDRAQRALEMGAASDAAERQVASCTERIDELETQILEGMDARETLEAEIDATTTKLAEATQAREVAIGMVTPAESRAKAEVSRIDGERATHIEALPSYERKVYSELVQRKGFAIARIEATGNCSACRQVVPYQIRTDLKEGRQVSCSSCARFLVMSQSEPVEA